MTDAPRPNFDDADYQAGRVPRDCSCHLSLLKLAYKEHLKDGTHNKRLGGPKEALSAV